MLKIKVHERMKEAFNPKTVTIGDQVWMAENLAVDDGGDGIYVANDGTTYYSHDAAIRIAENTPGWHLPTNAEWRAAAEACGAYSIDHYGDYTNITKLKRTLNIKMVGYYAGAFYPKGFYADYWTSDVLNNHTAYFYRFSLDGLLKDHTDSIEKGCVIRLIKD